MPGVARDTAGRRVYNARHVSWLELLDRLRRTGMSVADLRAYTALALRGNGATRETREMLLAHRAHVKQAITEWNSALKLIDAKIGYYSEWIAGGERPKPGTASHHVAVSPQSGRSCRAHELNRDAPALSPDYRTVSFDKLRTNGLSKLHWVRHLLQVI